jgi:hypothetical protein
MKSRIALVFAVLWIVAPLVADAPVKDQALTRRQLENATYTVEDVTGNRAPLVNGHFQDTPVEPGAATRTEVTLVEPIATGDLDGDGLPDSVVLLAINPGGSGTFIELAVVLNDKGNPRHIGSASLGDRVKVRSISIQNRIVTVDLLTQGKEDAAPDPKFGEIRRFVVRDGKLMPLK